MTYAQQGAHATGWRSQDRSPSGWQVADHQASPGFGEPDPQGPLPTQHDPVAAENRNQVIDRLQRMNSWHGNHAWDMLSGQKQLGPHALAFFYLDSVAASDARSPGRSHLAAATRLVSDGDDTRDLPSLLSRFVRLAHERYLPIWDFDPRKSMTDKADPMSERAVYFGVGISTLDTQKAPWTQLQLNANSQLDIGGRGIVLLTDGTQLIVERNSIRNGGEVRSFSTHTLNVDPLVPPRSWAWLHDRHRRTVPDEVWGQLQALHDAVIEGGKQHISRRQAADAKRRRR